MGKIRIAVAGVGNCASALVQGIDFCRAHSGEPLPGVGHTSIGGWRVEDIEVVAAFDVDRRKVGQPLHDAVFAEPNCTRVFYPDLSPSAVVVQMAPILDGVAAHMQEYPEDCAFRPAEVEPVDVAAALADSGAEILVCYLPVGSEEAVGHFASACLEAGVALVNCVPVFIASDPVWAGEFAKAGLPVVGDDVKSQVGATMVHRVLTSLFEDRGVRLERTYQLNTGGNTDFLNMLESERLEMKRLSKTEAIQSQLRARLEDRDIHVGPSGYVAWQRDSKVCFIRMEGRGFGDSPIELELRLQVEDSTNSAGVVVDAIRCAKLALERQLSGPLDSVSAYYMKKPPQQMRDSIARDLCEAFINGNE